MLFSDILRDISENYSLGFQDMATPIGEEIVAFHQFVMIYITFIITGVL